MKKKKNIILFMGPPASGKGTQSLLLGRKAGLPVISTGSLCRAEIKNKTSLGIKIEKIVTGGGLVTIDLINKLLNKRLSKKDVKIGFILDGYPRNIKQLDYLRKKFNNFEKISEVFSVFYINVSDREVRARLDARRVCSCGETYHMKYKKPIKKDVCDSCGGKLIQREDDKPKVVSKRLKVFHKTNSSLMKFFSEKNTLIKINGEQEIKKIHQDIMSSFKKK